MSLPDGLISSSTQGTSKNCIQCTPHRGFLRLPSWLPLQPSLLSKLPLLRAGLCSSPPSDLLSSPSRLLRLPLPVDLPFLSRSSPPSTFTAALKALLGGCKGVEVFGLLVCGGMAHCLLAGVGVFAAAAAGIVMSAGLCSGSFASVMGTHCAQISSYGNR